MKFEEAIILLKEGKKIRLSNWSEDAHIYINKKEKEIFEMSLIFDYEKYFTLTLDSLLRNDWEIYEVKTELNTGIKPCPLCGSSAELSNPHLTVLCILCSNSECEARISSLSLDKINIIDRWNRRIKGEINEI